MLLRLALALTLILPASLRSETVHPVTGRHVAHVMGFGGAPWLVRPEREQEEAPDAALDAIGIPRGAVVGDVGAGVGYFTWRLAERVGSEGRVYADDIQPRMLEELRKNLTRRNLFNFETVVSAEDDPRLPAGKLDLVLLVDVYHEFTEPEKMLDGIHRALKPDGRLVLLEYRKEDPSIPILPDHKMSVAEVKAEVEPQGYHLDKVLETLPRQHILIFRRLQRQ